MPYAYNDFAVYLNTCETVTRLLVKLWQFWLSGGKFTVNLV